MGVDVAHRFQLHGVDDAKGSRKADAEYPSEVPHQLFLNKVYGDLLRRLLR